MTREQRDELRRLAERATPGPWIDDDWDNFGSNDDTDFDPVRCVGPKDADDNLDLHRMVCKVVVWDVTARSWKDAEASQCVPNAAFIAAAHPHHRPRPANLWVDDPTPNPPRRSPQGRPTGA